MKPARFPLREWNWRKGATHAFIITTLSFFSLQLFILAVRLWISEEAGQSLLKLTPGLVIAVLIVSFLIGALPDADELAADPKESDTKSHTQNQTTEKEVEHGR